MEEKKDKLDSFEMSLVTKYRLHEGLVKCNYQRFCYLKFLHSKVIRGDISKRLELQSTIASLSF